QWPPNFVTEAAPQLSRRYPAIIRSSSQQTAHSFQQVGFTVIRGIDPDLLKHREKRGPPDQISRAKHRGQVRIPWVSQPGDNLRFRTTLRSIKPNLDGLRQAEDTRLP